MMNDKYKVQTVDFMRQLRPALTGAAAAVLQFNSKAQIHLESSAKNAADLDLERAKVVELYLRNLQKAYPDYIIADIIADDFEIDPLISGFAKAMAYAEVLHWDIGDLPKLVADELYPEQNGPLPPIV